MLPKIAFIIINFNGKEDTLECLDSIFKIDYLSFKVYVVDNGSSDDCSSAIRSRFKEVVLIENKENLGFCIANNMGIKLALADKSEYIMILNNDTVVLPEVINELKSCLENDRGIGAVSPVVAYYRDHEKLDFYGTMIDWGNGDLCRQYEKEYVASAGKVLDIDFVTWCAVLIKSEALEKTGLLDEQLFLYYDDTDWSVRCQKAGYRTVLFPKTLVYHKISQSSGGGYSPLVYFYLFRNRFIFIKKHAPVLRKLQFCLCYNNDTLSQYLKLAREKSYEKADAVIDGFWSAISGCKGTDRINMPQALKFNFNLLRRIYFCFLTIKAIFKK